MKPKALSRKRQNHRIEPLNGRDAHPGASIEGVRGQALDDVLLVEFVIVVRRDVLLELAEGLFPQVAAIDQEENPLGAANLIKR